MESSVPISHVKPQFFATQIVSDHPLTRTARICNQLKDSGFVELPAEFRSHFGQNSLRLPLHIARAAAIFSPSGRELWKS